MERRVNTLMASTRGARSVRGKYSAAGYVERENSRQMYIADVPAGSAQDDLRDLNRLGYRSGRPWNETPTPVFESDVVSIPAPIAQPRRKKQQSFIDKLAYYARREKKDVAACVILLTIILMMTAVWGQKMVEGVRIQQVIASYEENTDVLEAENERLAQRLELAKSGERIRNLAQNELNMLRPERAQTEKIYIRAPEITAERSLQHNEEPRMELLDILLGLLNVFHIGE